MAALLPVVLRLQKRQTLWVRTRTAAEVCRSVLAFWSTPASYEAIGPEAVPELSGVLMSLNLLKVLDRERGHPSVEEFKQRYHQERVAGQMEYLSAHATQSAAEARRYRAATWISIGLAAGVNVWLFVSGRLSGGFALKLVQKLGFGRRVRALARTSKARKGWGFSPRGRFLDDIHSLSG